MTTEPTADVLAQIVEQLLLTENIHDPRLDHGTPTNERMVEFALRDEGIRPTPELIPHILGLVATKRGGQGRGVDRTAEPSQIRP